MAELNEHKKLELSRKLDVAIEKNAKDKEALTEVKPGTQETDSAVELFLKDKPTTVEE